jgi:uncharacterized membrane-anchored protein
MSKFSNIWTAVIIVAGLQTAALAWMVYDRLSLINSGREITLQTVPVDPRSLFRGDYVILNYEVSQAKDVVTPKGIKRNDKVYVHLMRDAEGKWSVQKLTEIRPDISGPSDVILKATVTNVIGRQKNRSKSVRLKYGIESYFVPEGTGKALEKKVRERTIAAIVAVGRDGEAAIKGLDIAGTRVLDPPLF